MRAGSATDATATKLGNVVSMSRRESAAFHEDHLDAHSRYGDQKKANGRYCDKDGVHLAKMRFYGANILNNTKFCGIYQNYFVTCRAISIGFCPIALCG